MSPRKRNSEVVNSPDPKKPKEEPITERAINVIRYLSAQLPEIAKSGHPGAPIGCAMISHVLFHEYMTFEPNTWLYPNRDRFVLSNGHACALQYTMLHLCNYSDMKIEDLKKFRQLNSHCPGHPENFKTLGVEVSTGPLGQGISNAVGMAIASKHIAARYNKDDFIIFDNTVFCICGDGCLQEGVSCEASSLAGHLGLGNLIALYDSNNITIDGDTDLSFTEDVAMRYRSYGWQVLTVADGNKDVISLRKAIVTAKKNKDQPTLIICKTIIGFGSLKEGSEKVHGSPLGADDLAQLKIKLNIEDVEPFSVPSDVQEHYEKALQTKKVTVDEWYDKFINSYLSQYPKEGTELIRRFFLNNNAVKPNTENMTVEAILEGTVPKDFVEKFVKAVNNTMTEINKKDKNYKVYQRIFDPLSLVSFPEVTTSEATRSLSGKCLNSLAAVIPEIVGGSADLTGSNSCGLKDEPDFQKGEEMNRYIRFGIREHGMAAICNGMFAHGGFRPFGATFLNFVTYAWGAARLSALSQFGVLYISTHDSIELGEDGPTHQPIETYALCRATPNMNFWRPADMKECIAAYKSFWNQQHTPSVLALGRGGLPQLQNTNTTSALEHGAYVLKAFDPASTLPKVVLAGSGSEVSLCVEAVEKELPEGTANVQVVSMPCWEVFHKQSSGYKNTVLPSNLRNRSIYVEAASNFGWDKYFDIHVGVIDSFGVSAPKKDAYQHFGITTANIVKQIIKAAKSV